MPNTDIEHFNINLDGDWSIGEVTEKLPLLTRHVARLSETYSSVNLQSGESHGLFEIDLAGITALDACGCQLLAHFLRAVQQCGPCTRISNIPEAFVSQIHLLGFDSAFNLSAHGSGE